jgi:Cu2+-containing amine oxidase
MGFESTVVSGKVHPLAPLSSSEITTSAHLIKGLFPQNTNLQFKAITLHEPEKRVVVPYLAAEHESKFLPHIARKAFVLYYIRNTVIAYWVDLWAARAVARNFSADTCGLTCRINCMKP